MNSCLCRLIIFLCFIVRSLQLDTSVTKSVTAEGSSPPRAVPKIRNELRVPVHYKSLNVDQVMSRSGSVRSGAAKGESIRKQKVTDSGPLINAHNRPRKNYILPGRRLRTLRQCRPYEVVGKDGECYRKKGKTGLYKHKNHVYGFQQRHRHPSSDQMAKEDPIPPSS